MQLTYFPRRPTDRPTEALFPDSFRICLLTGLPPSLVRISQSVRQAGRQAGSLPFSSSLFECLKSRSSLASLGPPEVTELKGLKSRNGEILARVLSFCESSNYKNFRVFSPPVLLLLPLSCGSDAIGIQKIGLALELVSQARFSFFSLVPHLYNAISTCMHA